MFKIFGKIPMKNKYDSKINIKVFRKLYFLILG